MRQTWNKSDTLQKEYMIKNGFQELELYLLNTQQSDVIKMVTLVAPDFAHFKRTTNNCLNTRHH